jgi:membrane-associated phospholipid phosphatase
VRWVPTLAVVAGLAAARPAGAEPARSDDGRRRLTHLAFAAGGGVLYAITETIAKPPLAPDHCRWCSVDGLDDRVRSSLRWSDPARAASISNLTGFVATPVLMFGLTALAASGAAGDGERAGRILDDTIPIFETVMYSELVTQAVKFSFGRQRPEVHFGAPGAATTQDDNLSFFSGHATLTFGLAVSAGVVAHRRGSALEPVIWATGLTLATTTAYLRIAADKHYLTDVLAGAAWGTAAGILVPRLTHALPPSLHVVPAGNGIAVAGTF